MYMDWGEGAMGEGGVSQDRFTARVNARIGEHDRRIE